jgi:hypothetical protein
VCWSLYTTVRYFLAFAIYPSNTNGYAASLILATLSLVSVAVLFAAAAIPFLQTYLLGRNITITALLTVRTVLRYAASALLLVPAAVNFALVFAWRHSALAAGDRCAVDLDVVWPIHSHAGCAPPPWDAWLALAIVRLVLTGAVLVRLFFLLLLFSCSFFYFPSFFGYWFFFFGMGWGVPRQGWRRHDGSDGRDASLCSARALATCIAFLFFSFLCPSSRVSCLVRARYFGLRALSRRVSTRDY